MGSKLELKNLKELSESLRAWSSLEKGRLKEPHSNPLKIQPFSEIHELIAHSLKAPNLVRTQTPMGSPLPKPRLESRGFADEALIQKLIRYRGKVPLSAQVIRASKPERKPS